MIIFKFSLHQTTIRPMAFNDTPSPSLQERKIPPSTFVEGGMEEGAFRPVDAVYRLTFATLT